MKTKILFFSRGRGHGHAIPDMAIAEELNQLGEFDLTFASYATGAQTFRTANYRVRNLGLPENNAYLPTLFKARELIDEIKPDVVVTHEEFAVLPAAQLCGAPVVFLCSWFPTEGKISSESLAYASSIIIIENPGVFPVPSGVNAKPVYVGPILRNLRFTLADRSRLRRELKLADDSTVILVVPGGAATEENSPIAETVVSAFLQLPHRPKHLFWLSSKDYPAMRKLGAGIAGFEALEFVDPIERLLVVADAVITKGTHNITLECSSLGVPSISLSPGFNPIDDMLVPRIPLNISLNARAVDGEVLKHYLEKAFERGAGRRGDSLSPISGAAPAARALHAEIHRLIAERDGQVPYVLAENAV